MRNQFNEITQKFIEKRIHEIEEEIKSKHCWIESYRNLIKSNKRYIDGYEAEIRELTEESTALKENFI